MENITHHYHKLRNKSLGLLLLRLAVGAIFIYAGLGKLTNMSDVIPFFTSIGIAPWLAWAIALLEFVGGIMVVVGWWSKFFTGALFVITVAAMILTKGVALGTAPGNLHWLLLGALAAIFLAGCGRFSLCALKHHRDCATCKTDEKCRCEH